MPTRPRKLFIAAVALASIGIWAETAVARTERMAFAACLDLVEEVAEELGSTAENVLDTKDVRVVRIAAADGAVSLSCNRAEGTVKLSRTSSARAGS